MLSAGRKHAQIRSFKQGRERLLGQVQRDLMAEKKWYVDASQKLERKDITVLPRLLIFTVLHKEAAKKIDFI